MKKLMMRYATIAAVLLAAMAMAVFAGDVKGGTVRTGSAVNLRAEASTNSSVLGKMYDGQKLCVLQSVGEWYEVALSGIVGFVHSDYVELSDKMNIEAGGAKVTTEVLNLRSQPSTSSEIVSRLSQGTVVKIIGINTGWLKVEHGSKTGYIHPDYVDIVPNKTSNQAASSSGSTSSGAASDGSLPSGSGSQLRQDILDYARTFLGVKYVYGGATPKGFDCSGFTKYVFAHFGITLQRSSASQYSSLTKINKSDLKPGDLVFFSRSAGSSTVGHVGIYISDGRFIHASSPGDVVKYDSMYSNYYSSHYIGSARVIND